MVKQIVIVFLLLHFQLFVVYGKKTKKSVPNCEETQDTFKNIDDNRKDDNRKKMRNLLMEIEKLVHLFKNKEALEKLDYVMKNILPINDYMRHWTGELLLRLGLKEKAASEFKKVIAYYENPTILKLKRKDVYLFLPKALAGIGRVDEAIKLVEKCYHDPEVPKEFCSYEPVILILDAMGNYKKALSLIKKDVSQSAKLSKNTYMKYIKIAFKTDDKKFQLKLIKKALSVYPDDEDLNSQLGYYYFLNDFYNKSVSVYYKMALKNPYYPGILGTLAGAFNAKHYNDVFIKKVKENYKKNKDSIVDNFLLGVINYYNGNFKECIKHMEKLFDKGLKEARIYVYSAMSYYNLGDNKKAEKLITKAYEVDPTDPDVYYCHAIIFREKDKKIAIKDLELYLKMVLQKGMRRNPLKELRVKTELDILKHGKIPPRWDVPGKEYLFIDYLEKHNPELLKKVLKEK